MIKNGEMRNEIQRPETINFGGEVIPMEEYEKNRESEGNDNGGEDYPED